ncbi:autotransporter assembly complex protein TamA [Aurantimonas sp. MSK8Z-1]|uniref:autotransporter assembly complex protein TamA n=1 Tax=Mangrovibrevibacter kandeliae TaxID=2968473 RepID=UPI00211877E2|nr:autotransporter assembly complex family protein [Aurantimonas sp. MSK8Z-1]MCW4115315.1 autotransporter assembly complex protein TamA [Aurantimonas sp. MSK8Z-1]
MRRQAERPRQRRGTVFGTACLGAALTFGSISPAFSFEFLGFKFFEKEDANALVLDPVNYTVTLTVEPADKDLQDILEKASTLVAQEDEPVSGSLGLLSRANNDRKRIVAALYENARYDGVVKIFIEGQDVDTLPPDTKFDTAQPVPVLITVDPGQSFTMGRVDIQVNGVPIDPAPYELEPGSGAQSVRLLQQEGKLLQDLRNEGRPFVAVTHRDIVADSATGRLDYDIDISPGEPVPFGETSVSGAKDVDPGFIAYMAGIEPGTIFAPKDLEKARDRLVKLGVFSSVTVKEAKAQAADGTIPVAVEVGERKFRYFGFGATYSNTEGGGVSGYWGHRNLFGHAESIRLDASVSRIGANLVESDTQRATDELDYSAGVEFRKPGVLGPDSVYVGSLKALTEHPLAYDRKAVIGSSGVEYNLTDTQTLAVALQGEYAEITDYLGTRDYITASVPITYTYDGRDDKLNPTEGFYAKLFAEPTYEIEGATPFLKTRADLSSYLSLTESDRLILAGRVAYGAIFGADEPEDVPNNRRFYAGGGGSVRGYSFQSIGPYFPDFTLPGANEDFEDTPRGGLSLFEASGEVRIGITENIQIVPFVDVGAVGTELTPDFSNLKIGVGVGARYLTSFGPIRIDVGLPLDKGPRDADFEIYAGIGQSF